MQYLFACLDKSGRPRPPDVRDLLRLRASDTWHRNELLADIDNHNERIIRSRQREQLHIHEELKRDVNKFLRR